MNKKNLRLLADYLKKVNHNVFDMKYHRTDDEGEIVEYINKNDCGTVGCALGWAPFVDGLKPIDDDFYYKDGKKLDLNFIKYCLRLFQLNDNEWEWCFGGAWVKTDNTPTGAARRIEELADNDLPKNWRSQMDVGWR